MLVFAAISALTVLSSIMVMQAKKTMHSALYLAGSLIGFAALYILLGAEFLAIIQILVYIGGVITLILFTIMLTRKGGED